MAANPSALNNSALGDLDFNLEELRARYAEERNKRLRADGNDQYVEIAGELAAIGDDPYVKRVERAPIHEKVEVLIIGGGFGGLISAARLAQAGITDVRIVERGGDFGGTWYWNRYPGAQCDIESYIYLPLLEETGYIPREKYSYAPEILEHAQRIGRHFKLYERALFQTITQSLRWDEAQNLWHVKTDRGDHLQASFVVLSSGPLNRPKLPGIPGLSTFKGHMFHTSRWDYDYTGGDSTGGLHKLADKRVGVIGTGATAIQCVPYVAKHAGHLCVFQRTPSAIDVRGNKPTDPEWARSLRPGWQRERNHNFAAILSAIPQAEDLVKDGWTDLFKALGELLNKPAEANMKPEDFALLAEVADFRKMNQIRHRVDEVVKDPATASALKPWYKQWCKRPTFNDEFLPAFNRPNVTLVDTQGKGVERITAHGAVVNGVEYPLDCLIFATGFEVGTAYTRRSEFEVHGRNGVSLSEYWARGMRTYHGFYSSGFPNCFHLGLTQTGLAPNFTYMLNEQSLHVAWVINAVKSRGARRFEALPEAEAAWVETVSKPGFMSEYQTTCTPGYYNAEGKSGQGEGFLEGQYGEGPVQFYTLMEKWREQSGLSGLVLS